MTLFDLTGRVAVVTGGNGGIGLGMAKGLAAAGAAVAVAARNTEKGEAAVAALSASGAKSAFIALNVVDEGSCDGEVESDHQLAECLSVAAKEHGQAVGAVGGGGDAAHWVDDTDGDLTVVDQVGDVRQGRGVEGGFFA